MQGKNVMLAPKPRLNPGWREDGGVNQLTLGQ